MNCENDLADRHPDVSRKVLAIVKEAHVDSTWYVNPGESEDVIAEKKGKAKQLEARTGLSQRSVGPNSRFLPRNR